MRLRINLINMNFKKVDNFYINNYKKLKECNFLVIMLLTLTP